MSKKIGKIKNKKWQIYTTYQWFDLIPIGGISPQLEKEYKFFTQKTTVCVYLDKHYYGLDLFEPNNISQLKGWDYIFNLSGDLALLLTVNSIGDKYKIAIARLE